MHGELATCPFPCHRSASLSCSRSAPDAAFVPFPVPQEFCLDPEARECALTQPADPLSYDPQTHLSKWSRR